MKRMLLLLVCALVSLTMSAQWRGYGSRGGFGHHQRTMNVNPAMQYQRDVMRQQQMVVRQQRNIAYQQQRVMRQQMRMAFGYNVYFSNGYYYYTHNDSRVVCAFPQQRIYIYSKSQLCDAMKGIIIRTLMNGNIVFIRDNQTGELTQLTLE